MTNHVVGLRGFAYEVGALTSIDELPELRSDASRLRRFRDAGFNTFAKATVSRAEQAILSSHRTLELSALDKSRVDAVVIGTSELRGYDDFPERIASEIIAGIGLNHVPVMGVTFGGCANVASVIRAARNLVLAEGYRNVLAIEVNQVGGTLQRTVGENPRESIAYVYGDGSLSLVVGAEPSELLLRGIAQSVSVPAELETSGKPSIAMSIAGSRRVVERVLDQAGLRARQVDFVFFNNLSNALVVALQTVLGLATATTYTENIARVGHVWSADGWISLHDFRAKHSLPSGARVLLVSGGIHHHAAILCEVA